VMSLEHVDDFSVEGPADALRDESRALTDQRGRGVFRQGVPESVEYT